MNYLIETIALTKRYKQQFAVNAVNLKVKSGEIYGLLGRNGAGKTTTLKMLLRLTRPDSGEIKLFGNDYRAAVNTTYRRIGSMIETPGFYENLTASENLRILARLRGKQRKDLLPRALEIVGMERETKKVFGNYSLGMKQRLGLAAAIMHEPELLILDEPTNGLDPVGISEVRLYLEKLCREKGTTILISSHILSEIEQLAHTIGVLHEGQLLEEIAMTELRKKNRHYVEYGVSDEAAASRLLEEQFAIKDYSVQRDGGIRVYSDFDDRGKINGCFVANGIEVNKVAPSEDKLEDYFSKLIGGGRIG